MSSTYVRSMTSGPTAASAPSFCGSRPAGTASWNRASVIEMTGTWDDYWSARDGHFRGNVRRGEARTVGDVPVSVTAR